MDIIDFTAMTGNDLDQTLRKFLRSMDPDQRLYLCHEAMNRAVDGVALGQGNDVLVYSVMDMAKRCSMRRFAKVATNIQDWENWKPILGYVRLAYFLNKLGTTEDLKQICFKMKIDYDNLTGETKIQKALAFAKKMKQKTWEGIYPLYLHLSENGFATDWGFLQEPLGEYLLPGY